MQPWLSNWNYNEHDENRTGNSYHFSIWWGLKEFMTCIKLHNTFLCHTETCKPAIHQLSQLIGRYFMDKPHQLNQYLCQRRLLDGHTKIQPSSKFSVLLHSPLPSTICIWFECSVVCRIHYCSKLQHRLDYTRPEKIGHMTSFKRNNLLCNDIQSYLSTVVNVSIKIKHLDSKSRDLAIQKTQIVSYEIVCHLN